MVFFLVCDYRSSYHRIVGRISKTTWEKTVDNITNLRGSFLAIHHLQHRGTYLINLHMLVSQIYNIDYYVSRDTRTYEYQQD